MKKATVLLLFFLTLALPFTVCKAQQTNTTTSITVVSDTTDSEDFDSPFDDEEDLAESPTITTIDFDDNFFGFGNLVGHMLNLGFFMFLLILAAPLIIIALLIYLLLRRKNTGPRFATQQPTSSDMKTETDTSQLKERAILHMAVGVGIIIALALFASKLGMAAGIVLTCYGIGEYINARRKDNQ